MNLLLEIGVEELPAEYARRAWHELAHSKLLAEALGGAHFIHTAGPEGGLYTPRRLALVAAGFPEKHADAEVQVTGPSRKAAFDAEGKPTRALEGFIKGQGITLEQVFVEGTSKGEYMAARVVRRGAAVREALEKALPLAMGALNFPRTMRWEPTGVRFARPVRWIAALLNGEPLEVRFADVTGGTRTCGHRFYHPGFLELPRLGPGATGPELVQAYMVTLAEHGVMVSADRRRAHIRSELGRLSASLGGRLLVDEELVDITADLVEWPATVAGGFERTYLRLPREVIVTAMREHQRYFAALSADGGLLPNFLCVANASRAWFEACARDGAAGGLARGLLLFLESGEAGAELDRQPGAHAPAGPDPQALDAVLAPIARGNERVLRARLDDATFYWESDLARWRVASVLAASEQAERLRGVAWLEGWGSMYEKAERVSQLVQKLGPDFGLKAQQVELLTRAAWLMKLDLTCEMIKDGKEFTSLEGRMGALYAGACGEPIDITQLMAEHYLPRASVTELEDRAFLLFGEGSGEGTLQKLPGSHAGRVLALSDKLDSIAGFFAAGRIPSGSEDPFGVRRLGNGVVALLLAMGRDQGVTIPSGPLHPGGAVLFGRRISEALGNYGTRVDPDKNSKLSESIFEFLLNRLRAFLVGEATEAVNSALVATSRIYALKLLSSLNKAVSQEMAEVLWEFSPAQLALRTRQISRLLDLESPVSERQELYGLSTLYKRVSNILKDQSLTDDEPARDSYVDPERRLLEVLDFAEREMDHYYETRAYDEALQGLLRLRAPIDQFFTDVMVLAEDHAARDRRLKLLRRIQRLFLRGWDFSQVSVPAADS